MTHPAPCNPPQPGPLHRYCLTPKNHRTHLREITKDYEAFKTQTGVWANVFDQLPPEAMTPERLKEGEKEITFKHIHDHLKKTGGIEARLRWFLMRNPTSLFYQYIGEPLCSMGTAGSIDVERAIKPLKNKVMIKSRNRLKIETAELCTRCGINMRLLLAAKIELKLIKNPMIYNTAPMDFEFDSDTDEESSDDMNE